MLAALDLEGHTGGCLCLNLEGSTMEMVIFAKEVIGRLAEILTTTKQSDNVHQIDVHEQRTFHDGGTG